MTGHYSRAYGERERERERERDPIGTRPPTCMGWSENRERERERVCVCV